MAAKSKASGNFFAVVGSDEGMVREKALHLYNELTGGIDDGFTHETIDGIADNSDSAFDICSSVIQALQTIPMFGGDKVVWLRNANFLGDNVTGRSQRTEAGVESLRATLEAGLPDGVRFLLTAQGVDKRRGFWKFIEKSADVQVYDRIDTSRDDWQDQVAALVTRRAAELGLSFEPDALAIFVMLAGEQSQQIGNELEKLDLYLGPERRTITEDDVNMLVPLSRAAVVFEIGKAIQNGNAALAEESAASANALADRIAQLNGLVAGYRTEAGGTAAAGTAGALQRQVQAAFAGPRSARPSAPSARPAPPPMKKAVNAHASGWDEF